MARNCQINVWNEHDWELDPGMYEFVMKRVVARHGPQAVSIDIYPQERVPADAPAYKHPGWLEWTCNIKYSGVDGKPGGGMTIGCIQRKIDGEYESHS